MDTKTLLTWLKQTIEGNVKAAVMALKQNIFTVKLDSNKVEVTNPFKLPDIVSVKVSNPNKDYQTDIKSIKLLLTESFKRMNGAILSIKPSGSTRVNNFKELVIPVPPKEVKITNPQKEVTLLNIGLLTKELGNIKSVLNKLPKVYPQAPKSVTVDNFKELNTALEKMTLLLKEIGKETKVSNIKDFNITGTDAEKYVPVRLSDGKKFYKALEELSIGTTKNYAFSDSQGVKQHALVNENRQQLAINEDRWGLNNTETTGDTTYIGSEDADGNYLIKKIVDSDSLITMTYATKKNNSTITTYTYAWSHRTSISYARYSLAF